MHWRAWKGGNSYWWKKGFWCNRRYYFSMRFFKLLDQIECTSLNVLSLLPSALGLRKLNPFYKIFHCTIGYPLVEQIFRFIHLFFFNFFLQLNVTCILFLMETLCLSSLLNIFHFFTWFRDSLRFPLIIETWIVCCWMSEFQSCYSIWLFLWRFNIILEKWILGIILLRKR